jgi:hypothetical protein
MRARKNFRPRVAKTGAPKLGAIKVHRFGETEAEFLLFLRGREWHMRPVVPRNLILRLELFVDQS